MWLLVGMVKVVIRALYVRGNWIGYIVKAFH